MRVLVTGATGFIGSHFAAMLLEACKDIQVIGFSRNSDQYDHHRLGMAYRAIEGEPHGRLKFVWGDLQHVSGLCEGIDVVVNFAAKTFVDHSLKDDEPFIASNILGARALMQDARNYGVKRFVQVSTDEVYGQILTGAYKEDALLNPRNPYSWSKACADLYAIQLHRTYGFPAIITRTENNFGPWQHRQKVLPTFVRHALAGEPLPVYGDGGHVRCWLHVEEHCRAIWHLVTKSLSNDGTIAQAKATNHNYEALDVMTQGALSRTAPPNVGYLGEVFHIAGEEELTNLELAQLVLQTLGKPLTQIRYIEDHNIRPGHDRRYALDCSKLRATGFQIQRDMKLRLAEVVKWYAKHPEWTR